MSGSKTEVQNSQKFNYPNNLQPFLTHRFLNHLLTLFQLPISTSFITFTRINIVKMTQKKKNIENKRKT